MRSAIATLMENHLQYPSDHGHTHTHTASAHTLLSDTRGLRDTHRCVAKGLP